MIKEIFLKKTKSNLTKTGFTTEKWTTRICDECGKIEEVRYGSIVGSRRKRKKDVDVCKKCSYLSKYRTSVFRKTMEEAVNWKGGRSISGNGYKRIYAGGGKRIFEHVQIYENYIGRKLVNEERLHHIDMNKLNNQIDNLYLCDSNRSHKLCHDSAQELAKKFLNKKIWFDRKNKIYTIEYAKSSHRKKIDIPSKCSILIHTSKSGRLFKYKAFRFEGKRKYVHTYIVEKDIGRRLYAFECVHHIDENTLNNDINNLIVMSRSEHRLAHDSLQRCVIELYREGIVKFKEGVYYV